MPTININAQIKSITQSLQASLSSNKQNFNVEMASGIIYTISPTAKVEGLPNGNYLITITDKNGTTTAEIPNFSQYITSIEQIKTQPTVRISSTQPTGGKTGDIWLRLVDE